MNRHSKYNKIVPTENLKITYFLGAGASYNSIPIWKAQASSMIDLGNNILKIISENNVINMFEDGKYSHLINNKELINLGELLIKYGEKGNEYGSVDIYAKRLFLINQKEELKLLKSIISIYFDLWESDLFPKYKIEPILEDHKSPLSYEKIDKRYYSLFSIILEKIKNHPKLNKKIKFISWNYDLQIERAYESFLANKTTSLQELNNHINFLDKNNTTQTPDIVHLNGHRGMFNFDKTSYDTILPKNIKSIYSLLSNLTNNRNDFNIKNKMPDYSNFIKYGWEEKGNALENAKNIMKDTNILIIVGYSFPAFNRKIDTELIWTFEKNNLEYKKVIYQDPFANSDIINSIFQYPDLVEYEKKNKDQFYIPHEFLFPTSTKHSQDIVII